MEDFDALASSLAVGLGDVRGCLILSRDGLVLGSSSTDAEASLTRSWVRFAALGDTERGFAQFGSESWCYVRRGPYAAFAITGPGARPGLVLDQIDQALLPADEGRARLDFTGPGADIPHPSIRPRTLLHPAPHHGKEPLVTDVPRNQSAFADPPRDLPPEPKDDLGFSPVPKAHGSQGQAPDVPAALPEPGGPETTGHAEAPDHAPGSPDVDLAAEGEPAHADEPAEAWDGPDDPWDPAPDDLEDVDRFSLAREFGQLLQRGEDPADG